MFSTRFFRSWIAFFAAAALALATACEPMEFEEEAPINEDPDMPPVEEEIEPAEDEPIEEAAPLEEELEPTVEEEGFEYGWTQTREGIREMRRDVAHRAQEAGEDVDEALRDFDERVRGFERDISDAIRDFYEPDELETIEEQPVLEEEEPPAIEEEEDPMT